MPDLLMCTEASALFVLTVESRSAVHCTRGKQFETFAEMQGIDIDRLDPDMLHEAAQKCTVCACRKACRRWLRTGVFEYAGDSRCPNITLLRN